MKYKEIKLSSIKMNLKRNKKGMAIIFLSIFLFGSVWAYVDKCTFEQDVLTPEDTIVQNVDFSHLEKDETYYYYAFMEVKEKVCALNAYLQYLKQVKLNGENMQRVSELEEAALEAQRLFKQIQEFYIGSKPIICDNLERTEKFITGKIEANKLRLQEAEQTLEDLGKKAGNKERHLRLYAMQNVEIWENYLERVKNITPDEIQYINSTMDQLLEKGKNSINGVVEEFNKLIKNIEKEEQYDVVYNRYLLRKYSNMAELAGEFEEEDAVNVKKDEALVYARSIAGLDSQMERFCAEIMFFTLLGTMLSLLYGCLKDKEKYN